MNAQHSFLKSSKYGNEEEIRFQGIPILDTYEDGVGFLSATMPRYMRLFSSPAVKRNENDTLHTVAWYGDGTGQIQTWGTLDQTSRVRVATILRSFIGDLLARIQRFDEPKARMLLGWLNILSFESDLLVVNGQPVITNWGIVPAGVAANADRMTHHLLRGIGQFLPEHYDLTELTHLMMELGDGGASDESDVNGAAQPPASAAPAADVGLGEAGSGAGLAVGAATASPTGFDPLDIRSSDIDFAATPDRAQDNTRDSAEETTQSGFRGAAQGVAGNETRFGIGAGAAANGAALGGAGDIGGSGGEGTPGNRKDGGGDTRGRGCWMPVLIACIVALLVLLIVLIPGVLIYPYGSSNASLLSQTTLHQSEEALRGRIAELRQQLGQRSCRAAPGLLGPDGSGMIGPDGKAEVPVGPVAASSVSDLVPLLDRTTVLVLASGPKNEVSSGSGFLIAPDRIVTNRHVVEMASEGKVFVINETLGGLRPAKVLAKSSSDDLGDKDYALLQMEGEPARSFLQLTNVIDKGQQTYAAGFPGFFMETDSKFRELLNGNTHAAPSMVLTQGIVTVFQDSPSGVKLVLHSADISPGNSGGPLVDACGRVVGVNTFIKTSGEAQVRLNFALKSDSLEEFLARNGVRATSANDPCSMAPAQVKAGQ